MDHRYFEDRISAYKDKGLPADEYQIVGEHLEQCESCRQILANLQKLDRFTAEHADLSDDAYWERAAQKIEQRLGMAQTEITPVAAKKSRSGMIWRISAVAASLVLITSIALHRSDIVDEQQILDVPKTQPMVDTLQSVTPQESIASSQRSAESVAVSPRPERDVAITGESRRRSPAPAVQESEVSQPTETAPKHEVIDKFQVGGQVAIGEAESDEAQLEIQTVQGEAESQDAQPQIAAPRRSAGGSSALEDSARQLSTVTADTVAEDADSAIIAQLNEWRKVRETMMAAAQKTSSNTMTDMTRKALQPTALQKSSGPPVDPVRTREQKLLEACYYIARLSSDTVEVRRSTDYIRRVAGDTQSPDRDTASVLLQRLTDR